MNLTVVLVVLSLMLMSNSQKTYKERIETLRTLHSLPELTRRKIGCVVGAVQADAGSVSLQWIYDVDQISGVVADSQAAFWPVSHNPYFNLSLGSNSMYGDEFMTTLKTIARDGDIQSFNIARALVKKFGSPSSPYQTTLEERGKNSYPLNGPWITKCMINTVNNFNNDNSRPSGSESCQDNDAFFTALPAFLLNLDLDEAEQVVRLVTGNNLTLHYTRAQFALLRHVITRGSTEQPSDLETSLGDEFSDVADDISDVFDSLGPYFNGEWRWRSARPVGLTEAVQHDVEKWGQSCKLPGVFRSQMSVLAASEWNYAEMLELNIRAGGDICGRAMFLGAVLGAHLGYFPLVIEHSYKQHWSDNGKLSVLENIIETAIKAYS